jgi:hypothetical protein
MEAKMAHPFSTIFSVIPIHLLHALAFVIGSVAALAIAHMLLVKSSKAVFASRRRSTPLQ